MHDIDSIRSTTGRVRGARRDRAVPTSQLCLFRDWLPRVESMAKPMPVEPRTALMQDVLRLFRRAARTSQPAPSNGVLATKLGSRRQSTARAVKQLEAEGYIQVEVSSRGRRIRLPDGRATDWGEFREGHAPGPRGQVRAPKMRAPNSLPMRAAVVPLPHHALRAPHSCQFPMWEDGERPRERSAERFCGAPVVAKESWCLHHLGMVSPRRAQMLAKHPVVRSASP